MPVARGPQINARSALLVGATGVAVALLLGVMVVWVASRSDTIQVQLGDTQFDAGFIGRQADEIETGGPILYADAGTGTRDLYVQHIGTDDEVGWLAFEARRIGDPRDCTAAWDTGTRTFTLLSSSDVVCDPVTFDELGCGLPRFPAEVIDGSVIVFLNENFDEVAAALAAEEGTEPVDVPAGADLGCSDS